MAGAKCSAICSDARASPGKCRESPRLFASEKDYLTRGIGQPIIPVVAESDGPPRADNPI